MVFEIFFETERLAYKTKGWRGPIEMVVGFVFGLIGLMLLHVFKQVLSFVGQHQVRLEGAPVWIFLGIEFVALLIFLQGAWHYYQDTMYQAWRYAAEEYKYRGTRF